MIPDPVFYPVSGPVFVPDRIKFCPVRYFSRKIEILSGPVRSGPVLSGTVGKYVQHLGTRTQRVATTKVSVLVKNKGRVVNLITTQTLYYFLCVKIKTSLHIIGIELCWLLGSLVFYLFSLKLMIGNCNLV